MQALCLIRISKNTKSTISKTEGVLARLVMIRNPVANRPIHGFLYVSFKNLEQGTGVPEPVIGVHRVYNILSSVTYLYIEYTADGLRES